MTKITKEIINEKLSKFETNKEKLEVLRHLKAKLKYMITNANYVTPKLTDEEILEINEQIEIVSFIQADLSTAGNRVVRVKERVQDFRSGKIWEF